jgi:hypothetical protein
MATAMCNTISGEVYPLNLADRSQRVGGGGKSEMEKGWTVWFMTQGRGPGETAFHCGKLQVVANA